LALTVVTGVVDAVSILRLGRVFGAVGGALLVLHAGTAPALGLATGLLAVVTAGAALATRQPGPWRAG
jgi:hypothetical protein